MSSLKVSISTLFTLCSASFESPSWNSLKLKLHAVVHACFLSQENQPVTKSAQHDISQRLLQVATSESVIQYNPTLMVFPVERTHRCEAVFTILDLLL